jgi:hypothetical protein
MNFYDEMKKNTLINTENGAKAYLTTGKSLLDLNFAVGSMRNWTDEEITNAFHKAMSENPVYGIRWLFYARNVRGGMGERRIFRVCLKYLVENYGRIFNYMNLYLMVQKYGRIDDFFTMYDYIDHEFIDPIVKIVFEEDVAAYNAGLPISLLAKWLPSINTSSPITRARGRKVRQALGLSPREYRTIVAKMRSYSNVIETKISANNWSEVNYEAVPSMANLKYKDAFMRHDSERREQYLKALADGEAKINSSVTFPHDIVAEYSHGHNYWDFLRCVKEDATLEAMWKALPREEVSNTLVVADGSGSMCCRVGQSGVTALDVANALAIYFSECNTGVYANRYITFSSIPEYVEFKKDWTLREKLSEAFKHDECENTNIEAVFNLILRTAVNSKATQEEMPKRILVISDMEFDWMTYGRTDKALFEELGEKYAAAGYALPKLIFWNVNSRTMGIPLTENENGVALLSGFSPASIKMAMTNETDPYKILIDELDKYKEVDRVFMGM